MRKEQLGTVLAIATAVLSGIAIPANKVFVVDIDAAVFTAIRSVIVGAIFLFLSWRQFDKTRPKDRKFIKSSWKYLATVAVIGGALAFLLFFTGLKLTTAGRAAFLQKTLPLYTAVLAFVFLKEKMTRKYLLAMLLMVAGIMAIYSTSMNPAELWANPQLGDLLVISAAFLWAVENVVAKKAMTKGETNFVVSFSRMFFGGLILFGMVLFTGKISELFALSGQQFLNIGISVMLLLAYVFFYYWSIRLINVSKAATILLLAPVVSLVVGMMFLGEPLPLTQLAGSAFVLAGAYFIVGMRSEQRGV